MMRQTPLCHDAASPADDAGGPAGRHRNEPQQYSGVNGKIIYALFSLLNECVPENFPSKIFGAAIDFLQCLINRHGTDGHWTVSNDPLTSSVDVFAGRQIHHRVRTPLRGPPHFFYLLFNTGSDCAVADVGIDFH